jgi:SpoVK/Ycf46/Vps4 family AAA+-type ATPase
MAQLRRIPGEFVQRRAELANRVGGGRTPRKGMAALFTGPSGTGKTLAAEAIAGELRSGIVRADLRSLVGTHAGEAEKNLDAVFSDAEKSEAILFFDEADALFGSRSEVKDAHDRFQNTEADYLLQRLEEHPGIVILATNRRQNVDEAFIRRMKFVVDFE